MTGLSSVDPIAKIPAKIGPFGFSKRSPRKRRFQSNQFSRLIVKARVLRRVNFKKLTISNSIILAAARSFIKSGQFFTKRQIFPEKVLNKHRSLPVHRDVPESLKNQAIHIHLNRRHIHFFQIGQDRISLRMIAAVQYQLVGCAVR